MAKKDSRHRGPEESRDAKHAYCLKTNTAKVDWPCYKNAYEELQEGKRSQGGQKKRYKDTLKASLKDFDIPMGSWEQTAQEHSKWRGEVSSTKEQLSMKKMNL